MGLLLLILLLAGTCGSDEGEALFCAECAELDGAGGAWSGAGGSTSAGDTGGSAGSGAGGEGTGGAPPCECDDGNPCNGIETCAGDGSCVTSESPRPADDDNACTHDYCGPNGVTYHKPFSFSDGDPCTSDSCSLTTGSSHYPNDNCMECVELDDGNACTYDLCSAGQSLHEIVDTDDYDPCTLDQCDPQHGVYHIPIQDCHS